MEVSDQLHVPPTLPPGDRQNCQYPLDRGLGGYNQYGHYEEEKNLFSLLGIKPQWVLSIYDTKRVTFFISMVTYMG
jgi:hypothetical protein